MEPLTGLLDVGNEALGLWGYSVSWLELFATLVYFVSVALAIRPHILTWPTGIVGNVALFALFFQIQLYSDMLLQVYFLGISVYGWWSWSSRKRDAALHIATLSARGRMLVVVLSLAGAVALSGLTSRLHLWLPRYFAQPAAFPLADAVTTVLSIVATVLLARKRIESWLLWILVDVVSLVLYLAKGVAFLALEYGIFLLMAVAGLVRWHGLLPTAPPQAKSQARADSQSAGRSEP